MVTCIANKLHFGNFSLPAG